MEIATIIASLKAATASGRKALELSKTMQNLELRTTIAELMNALAESSMNLADLKADLAQLKEENAVLKASLASASARDNQPRPKIKWGCYEIEGEEGLFCIAWLRNEGEKDPHHESGEFDAAALSGLQGHGRFRLKFLRSSDSIVSAGHHRSNFQVSVTLRQKWRASIKRMGVN